MILLSLVPVRAGATYLYSFLRWLSLLAPLLASVEYFEIESNY
jgi:hypothetical protein